VSEGTNPARRIEKFKEGRRERFLTSDELERLGAAIREAKTTGTLDGNLTGVRLHDLRHTYASFGAGGGLGLPIIGRLLGHSELTTTARHAHLDHDPLRRASEAIAGRIAAALAGTETTHIVPLERRVSH
jgi:integrase